MITFALLVLLLSVIATGRAEVFGLFCVVWAIGQLTDVAREIRDELRKTNGQR
jgi:hypothetical protein